jgi:hypothetical protein
MRREKLPLSWIEEANERRVLEYAAFDACVRAGPSAGTARSVLWSLAGHFPFCWPHPPSEAEHARAAQDSRSQGACSAVTH